LWAVGTGVLLVGFGRISDEWVIVRVRAIGFMAVGLLYAWTDEQAIGVVSVLAFVR